VARLTGQRARSTSPGLDTPQESYRNCAGDSAVAKALSARSAWRSITSSIAATPHVRISRDGGRTYTARHTRPLPADPPLQPCTVPIYDPVAGTGRLLALDLDPGRPSRDHADDLDAVLAHLDVDDVPVHERRERDADLARVRAQAGALVRLMSSCGGQVLADVAPSGGRHVYVLFAAPLPWRELRDLCRAIALRFTSVDPVPMCSLGGQISPPGSRHKSGGWRALTTPLSEALEAVERPNGPEVWNALLSEFAAELNHVLGQHDHIVLRGRGDDQSVAELDDAGTPWVPRLGGRANLGPELDRTARTGKWDRSRHAGRSEARMAVLCAAAARGWRLTDVRAAVASGTWKGLAHLYQRASEPGRMDRLLPAEWRRSVAFVAGPENVRSWLTSDVISRPPAGTDGAEEFGLIRRWVTGTDCAVADPERVRRWGRRSVAIRQLLAAIGQAAMVSGSSVIEHGSRNLALHSGLGQRTVSRLLQFLRDEPDPLIDWVSPRRMARADRYQLRIPDAYAERVRWRRRRAGRIDGIHPVFLILGGAAALVYQVLDPDEARGAEVARAVRLSPSATSTALRVLAEHG